MNWAMIGAFLVAAGIPSALVGFLMKRLNKKIDKRDEDQAAKESARVQNQVMLIKMVMASLSLGEATAEAIQRMPDANCNGEMSTALQFAKETKNEYREFEREQAMKSLN